jgi:hypothetical protein
MISPNTVASVASAIALAGTREGRWAGIPLYEYVHSTGRHCIAWTAASTRWKNRSPVCILGMNVSIASAPITVILPEGVVPTQFFISIRGTRIISSGWFTFSSLS